MADAAAAAGTVGDASLQQRWILFIFIFIFIFIFYFFAFLFFLCDDQIAAAVGASRIGPRMWPGRSGRVRCGVLDQDLQKCLVENGSLVIA
jgi:hypothetical protein